MPPLQALEHSPEVFGSVCMLYVIMEVNPRNNNVPVKTFVGAARARVCSVQCAVCLRACWPRA